MIVNDHRCVAALGKGWTLTRLLLASALVLSIYDILITLKQEIDNIWYLPFSAVKALFFFVRYGNVVALLYANYSTL